MTRRQEYDKLWPIGRTGESADHARGRSGSERAACCYEDQQPGLGERFFEKVQSAIREIGLFPLRFGRIETVRTAVTVRRARVVGFPDIVVFDVQPDEILVLAVAHTSRRPGYWLKRRE